MNKTEENSKLKMSKKGKTNNKKLKSKTINQTNVPLQAG